MSEENILGEKRKHIICKFKDLNNERTNVVNEHVQIAEHYVEVLE